MKCKDGHYLSKTNCCPEGTYFKTNSCVAMDLSPSQDHCLIWLDAQYCAKCKFQTNTLVELYIHRGHCIEVGKYVDRDWLIKSINDTDDTNDFLFTGIAPPNTATSFKFTPGGFTGCKKLDDTFSCIQCNTGYSIQNGRCCPNGSILYIATNNAKYECVVISPPNEAPKDCLEFVGVEDNDLYIYNTKTAADTANIIRFQCKTCKANFYLTGDKVCCANNKLSLKVTAPSNYITVGDFKCEET